MKSKDYVALIMAWKCYTVTTLNENTKQRKKKKKVPSNALDN